MSARLSISHCSSLLLAEKERAFFKTGLALAEDILYTKKLYKKGIMRDTFSCICSTLLHP
jgi:hypothetical protein